MMNRLQSAAVKWFDGPYVFRFILRLLALYLFFRLVNWLMIGATVPGGLYSPFLDHYLNYITLIKVSVLQTGSWVAQLLGVDSFVDGISHLRIVDSKRLYMSWSCCGLEIMGFWTAFAFADTTPLRTKLGWCLGGLFCIWFINCVRVGVLAVAIKRNWHEWKMMDHHDMFNVVAYGFVLLLMLVYYKRNKAHLGL